LSKNRVLLFLLALGGLIAAISPGVQAAAPPATLTPVLSGDRFGIQWDVIPDAIYKVQSTTSLGPGSEWVTEEPVSTNQVGPIRWMAPESMSSGRFYRVVLPQPEIFSIEPSVIGTNGGTVYVVGQCLGTNGTLRLGPANGGIERPGSGDGRFMIVNLPPLPEGIYDVSWLDGQQVIATAAKLFSVTAEVQPAGITQELLEPPEGWLAAPQIVLKQRNTEDAVGQMREAQKEPAHVEVPNLSLCSGEVGLCVVDFLIPGQGIDFVWARRYRSKAVLNTPMGNGWDYSYNISIQPIGGDILIQGGMGRADRFLHQSNGTYSAPGYFCEGVLSNNVFRLTFPDTGFWEFNALDGSPQAGKISRSHDCHDNALTFGYDAFGRLTTIVDTLNRTNVVAYNSAGRIQSITDFSGRAFTYEYYTSSDPGGSDGDLAAAISPAVIGTPNGNDFPAGKTNRYTYSKGYLDDRENHLLLTMIDPKGQISHAHIYQHNQTDLEFLRCRSMQAGTNTPVTISVTRQTAAPSNHFAVCKIIVNDSVGNVSECFYDSRNRLVTMREYTGRAVPGITTTETVNRPTGKLRPSDSDFFESQWTWNNDHLCAMYVNPRSIARQQFFESDFDSSASARKRGDLRIVRELACDGGADTDGDGLPDLAVRAWRFSYDPRFGSPDMASRKGWDGTIKGRIRGGIRTKGDDVGMRSSAASQVKKVTVKGWNPEKKEAIVGSAKSKTWQKQNDADILGRFASGPRQTLPLDGDFGPHGSADRIICPTEDSGGAKPPTRFTDPLGNTFTCVLDGNGDPVHTETTERKGGAIIACDYNYKEHGRLVAVTNAPDGNGYRRVDLATYYTNGPQNGYLREWQVDAQGPDVLITSYEHDDHGKVTRCVDARDNDWLFTYNALDQCVRSQTPTNLTARCVSDFTYDANDNMVQRTTELRDENDAKITTILCVKPFDELNRCVSEATQVSSKHFVTNRFFYDGNGNLIAIHSPEAVNGHDANNIVAFEYDERDLLFREIRAPGSSDSSTNEYSYSPSEYVLERKKLKSGVAVEIDRCDYDGLDRVHALTDPMGNVVTRCFDANDNLVYEHLDGELNDLPGSALNRRLAETRCAYDSLDRCVRTDRAYFDPATGLAISDGASTMSWTYAPNSACLSVTDDNSHTTRFSYDTVGRLASVTDPKTNTQTYAHDAMGNVLSVNYLDRPDAGGSPQEFSGTYAYDALGRCVRSSDNVGNTTRYSFDSLGDCVRSVDARGQVSGASFDYLGRCTLAVADLDLDGVLDFAADVGRAYSWDDNSRLASVTDDNTNTTTYTYDSLNRWTLVQRPQGSTVRCVYDRADNVITNIDGNGTVVSFTYDLNDRCVRKDIVPGGGVAGTTTFEAFSYDGCSRCFAASNDISGILFAYDSLGNCVRSTQDGLTTASSFDGVGNCLSMNYPGGRVVSYTYDALHQSATIQTPLASGAPPALLSSFQYDGHGRLGRITRANNANTRFVWNGLLNPGNAPGDSGWRQISAVNHFIQGSRTIIDGRRYAYDQNQNKTLRAQTSPFYSGGPLARTQFGYDSLDRMRTAINTNGATVQRNDYTLDGNGNRQFVTNDGTSQTYFMDPTVPPGDLEGDQYTLTPFGSEQHDHNGNLVFGGSSAAPLQYHYDFADRLVEVDSFATGSLAPVVSFTYDALGRRISKTVYPGAPSLPVTTQFVYDGDKDCDGILEARVSGGIAHTFVWDSRQDLPAGKPALVADFDTSGKVRYCHADELGNALALTDVNGAVLERYDYDDYGAPVFLSSDGSPQVDGSGTPLTASPNGNSFLFHGAFWDSETGLYYSSAKESVSLGLGFACAQAVYTQPSTGRSLSRKPDELVFNVVNPRAARGTRPATCPSGECLGRNSFTFSGENPWSACAIYTEWAAGPRHYDDLIVGNDCDDNDPKRHRPSSLRTTFGFGVIVLAGPGADCFFERGDKPTQAQFGSLIDSTLNLMDDRKLLGLRNYDPSKEYLLGDTMIYNSSVYKPKPAPIPVKYLSTHVTLIK
jgi:YD repeat-containing protein